MKKIGLVSHLVEGKGLSVDLGDGRSIAVFLKEGVVYGIDNFCPHKGAPLSEGYLCGMEVVCPWHCWKFDIQTGRCSNIEGERVKKYDLIIKDGEIYLPTHNH